MAVVIHNSKVIDSWSFDGANWAKPDPADLRYWQAVILAIRERAAFANYALRFNYLSDVGRYRLHLASAAAEVGVHSPAGISIGSGQIASYWRYDNLVSFIRGAIREVSPSYLDKSRLKEALNLKQDLEGGSWRLNTSRADVYMPKYSFAVFAEKYPGLTGLKRSVTYRTDEDVLTAQSEFLAAVRKCVDDMFLISANDTAYNSGVAYVSSSGEDRTETVETGGYREGYDVLDSMVPGVATVRKYDMFGESSYPDGKRYSLSYYCDGNLYAGRDTMRSRILSMYPDSAEAAVSDAVKDLKESIPTADSSAVPDPDRDGNPADKTSGKTLYDYPRSDQYARYMKYPAYDVEQTPLGNDFVKDSGVGGTLRVNFGYSSVTWPVDLQSIVTVKNDGKSWFRWAEPRKEDDPRDKEYDDGSEQLGPLFYAQMNCTQYEFELSVPTGFEHGTTLELYSFTYARSNSSMGVSDGQAFEHQVPDGSNLSTREMVVDDPIVFDADENGKVKFSVGSRTQFPTNVRAPEDPSGGSGVVYQTITGYYAYAWAFLNGLGAFKFVSS